MNRSTSQFWSRLHGAQQCALVLIVFLRLLPWTCASESFGRSETDWQSLFDGASLDGWETPEGDRRWWKASDGVIAGGSLKLDVPHNTFLATKRSFANFELRLKLRVQGNGGFINSGVQIRSVRVPGSSEMCGYQVDAGEGWWGKLYDESRRNQTIFEPADSSALLEAVRENGWNDYRILADGPRIRSWINGVAAVDYVEQDRNVPLDGHLAFQVHGGGKAFVEFKDIRVRELPPTKGAMTWRRLKRQSSRDQNGVLSPSEEAERFTVPDGFEVELVAAETDSYGKFVTLAFDSQGRLWTTTALEYPVDANENSEASRQLFASGGRDQVLVFNKPWEKQVGPPTVFADGLAIPLGVLPYRDGAFVQYGSEIRFYRDADGDGRADGYQTVLEGFGTQDSHLFPHQFTRTPGERILMAQGLFNFSKVRRPNNLPFDDGAAMVPYDYCKLACFAPDGSHFEALTAGPNNIWGLTISREGETWLQEANDEGFPIIPYAPGGYYTTGSPEKLRPYQPLMPAPMGPAQMGGTGLSGLTLADDQDGWPAPWGAKGAGPTTPKTFYVANPITSSIQTIYAKPDGSRYLYSKGPDFLTSTDPRFRPVALQFGPDGSLYVVDWYNKIISHNEVPRNHPERDKTSGRIWRIRHRDQSRQAPPNLAATPTPELPTYLNHPNARVAASAWQELVDRQDESVVDELERIVGAADRPAAERLGALWALEGLAKVPASTLATLARDAHVGVRAEAVRIAGRQGNEKEFLLIAENVADDASPRVRASLGDALRRVPFTSIDGVKAMMKLAREPLHGGDWVAYDREFERFLARWAMESRPTLVAEYLNSPSAQEISLESRVLAALSLGGKEAAVRLAALIPDLTRPLNEEELRVLAAQVESPVVADAIRKAMTNPASRLDALRKLLELRTTVDSPRLKDLVAEAVSQLWREDETPAGRGAALDAIRAFALRQSEDEVVALAVAPSTQSDQRLQALKTLREIGASSSVEQISELVANSTDDPAVRAEAIAVLAESPSAEANRAILALWEELNVEEREAAVNLMTSRRQGAQSLLAAWEEGDLDSADFSVAALDRMHQLLPNHETMEALWSEVSDKLQRVLLLGGDDADAGPVVSLSGPFTVECWAKLIGDVSNHDSLLASSSGIDVNFYQGRLHIWVNEQGDAAIADYQTIPGSWTHYAVTRDVNGRFRIYVNGELRGESRSTCDSDFSECRIGWSTAAGGTHGELMELRAWDIARTPEEIRADFDRSYVGESRPPHLIHFYNGPDWQPLAGKARVEPTLDAPALVTASQAEQRSKMFAEYRRLATAAGDASKGRELFQRHCMTCHQLAGEGAKIGPPLDGVGLTGVEALLRNILTPSAAMEGGYRNYRVLTRDGLIIEGLLASKDERGIILRRPEREDAVIPLAEAARTEYSTTSVMPDGLLQAMKPEEVTDLFAYLMTGTTSPPAGVNK